MDKKETIAAISTPWGEGGIGIIRISGPEALDAGLNVFRLEGNVIERFLHYGVLSDPRSGERIDNGLFVYMKGPKSYTGDDVVELHCHGGPYVVKKVLEAVLNAGARLAEPGEFTKQAFLNGKIDLAQAEAVIDIIRSETGLALSSARGRLEGAFSRKIKEIKETITGLLTNIEAELDFSEEEIEGLPNEAVLSVVEEAEEGLKRLISTYEEGSAIRDGVKVLILGRPNVGKSSLLNILLQEERAIVAPEPGTTRDTIEEVLNIRGIPVKLIDTAGLRETEDRIESIGVKKAKDKIKDAGLILLVIDSASLSDEDTSILNEAFEKKTIIVANKCDLADDAARKKVIGAFEGKKAVFISALKSTGIEELKDAIYEEAIGRPYGISGEAPPGELVASLRHKTAIENAIKGVDRAKSAVIEGFAREFVATDLRYALDRLGEITGETTTEDILDRIFSSFCIGK